MEYIRVTSENIDKEHICCALSNNKDIQVISKKAWNPIVAEGYMYIDCLWVSGSLKGHGYGADLLNTCKEEAQDAPTPVTTYALFYDGAYLTNEQMNDRKFLKLLKS